MGHGDGFKKKLDEAAQPEQHADAPLPPGPEASPKPAVRGASVLDDEEKTPTTRFAGEPEEEPITDADNQMGELREALPTQASGAETSGAEPIPFERYVEIKTAQECWAAGKEDVDAMLKKTFGLSPIDWSHLDGYWAGRMHSDAKLVAALPAMQQKYRPQYQSAKPKRSH